MTGTLRTTSLVHGLIARGMFPRELPGCFSSRGFAALTRDRWSELPPPESRKPNGHVKVEYVANPAHHDLPRVGGGRRTTGIPNPISHMLLSTRVAADWPHLRRHLDANAQTTPLLAATRPMWWSGQGRALIPRYRFQDRWSLRLRTRAGARYMLVTDIAQFYPSIYTHAIPWALSSKATAKQRRRDSRLLGNELDRLARNGQDQQTVGLPIGPDTSLLIAECLLKRVDDKLRAALRDLRGFRYIDDYELSFSTLADAERARSIIAEALRELELRLNEAKTRIYETPAPLDEAWPIELATLLPRDRRIRALELQRYASKLFELASQHQGDAVMKRGLMSLRNHAPVDNETTQTIISVALNAFSDSVALPSAVALLVQLEQRSWRSVSRSRLADVIQRSLDYYTERLRSFEVIWLLWAAIAFKLKLTLPAGVSALDDDMVAILALHGQHLGFWSVGSNTIWSSWMTADELQGRHWLVAYEAAVRNWLPHSNHVATHPQFSFLEKHQVRFYVDIGLQNALKFSAFSPAPGGRIGDFYA